MAKAQVSGLIVLKAKKVKAEEHGYVGFKTELYQDGKLKATIPLGARQPKKGSKTIILKSLK